MSGESEEETREVPQRVVSVLSVADWARTGATIVAVLGAAVTVIRWTATVDDRLGGVEQGIRAQRQVLQEAAETTAGNAASAANAANRAEAAVVRAEAAVGRAETAVSENKQSQARVVQGTAANRQAVNALKLEMKEQLEALSFRVRQMEDAARKQAEHH